MESTDNWLLTVVGTGQKEVFKPGNLVIIGRTPKYLPAPGSSFVRFNIDNPQKSMSKRHISLQIDPNRATIKDLGSTNGTYLVKKDGALVRLPAGEEFVLDKSPVRLQLGNIGIILEKTADLEGKGDLKKEGDLFAHSPVAPSAFRSVKDVREAMKEREGEPTFLIDADSVAEKVKEKQKERPASSETEIKTVPEGGPENDRSEENLPGENKNIEKIQKENREKAKLVDKAIEERLKGGGPSVHPSSATVPLPASGMGERSLFERLTRSNGRQSAVVRLNNGMTSEEAERTESFARQFEFAKHKEMLPFLGLNPYLYPDLYMWLEALGDPVINAALQTNRGYQAFKTDGGDNGRI